MHAFVTGASSGIGEAIAKRFAAEGYAVTLVARRASELERVASELPAGARSRVVVADVSALEALAGLVRDAEADLGEIDVLVNNAGMQIVAPTPEVDPHEGERLFALNVFAAFRLTHAALTCMIPRRRGTIVDVASVAALAPPLGMFHYSASKAALAAASESLRAEVAPHGIHVVTVYPGPVETPMGVAAVDRLGSGATRAVPWGSTEELAGLVLAAVKRRRPRVIYPRTYSVTRFLPTVARRLIDWFGPRPRPHLSIPPASPTAREPQGESSRT